MLSADQLLEALLERARGVTASETVSVTSALGRVLAASQTSAITVPPLDNSAMDGYAVRAADVALAGARLPVSQRILAGTVGTPRCNPAPRRASSPAGRCRRAPTPCFVFRVDTRLRPYGDSGPLVVSFEMLESYLVTQGRAWERYAWIKGRPLTGNQQAALLALVRPFVFRRHLDYSAFASMRSLHSQVRHEVSRRDRLDDIKLGPGGIREIEFITQVFQLIRGGHERTLQQQPMLPVLAALGERQIIPPDAVAELRQAYVFLRNLEHRLQYRDDQQTQALPGDPAERGLVAASMGYADEPAFAAALGQHRAAVSRHFDSIFAAGDTDFVEALHPRVFLLISK